MKPAEGMKYSVGPKKIIILLISQPEILVLLTMWQFLFRDFNIVTITTLLFLFPNRQFHAQYDNVYSAIFYFLQFLLELKAITFYYLDILTLNWGNYNQAESYIISYGFFILILQNEEFREIYFNNYSKMNNAHLKGKEMEVRLVKTENNCFVSV